MGRIEPVRRATLASCAILALAACTEQPVVPELGTPGVAPSETAAALIDKLEGVALEYELFAPDERPGVYGFAVEAAPNGTAVFQYVSAPHAYWYRGGELTPAPEVPGTLFFAVRGIFPDGTDRLWGFVGTASGPSLPVIVSPDGSHQLLDEGVPRHVNRSGRLVGSRWRPAERRYEAGYWEDGVYTALPDEFTEAYWVNDAGLMVVERRVSTPGVGFQPEVGLYDPSTGLFQAPPGQLGPNPDRYEPLTFGNEGLNESGQAILIRFPAEGGRESVLWDGTQETVLPVPPGAFRMEAKSINDRGWVAGEASFSGSVLRPALYQDGMTDLLAFDDGTRGFVSDLNDSGLVIANASDSGESYILTGAGDSRRLPGVEDARSGASDINDSGLIVGSISPEGGPPRPAVWVPLGDEAVLQAIRDVLQEMADDGTLVHGVVRALTRKLDQGAYEAFINQIEALVRSRRLDRAIADVIISAVRQLDEASSPGTTG